MAGHKRDYKQLNMGTVNKQIDFIEVSQAVHPAYTDMKTQYIFGLVEFGEITLAP